MGMTGQRANDDPTRPGERSVGPILLANKLGDTGMFGFKSKEFYQD